ncbi:MAG TPA: hypothetical protein VFB22_17180 [Candidatus Baltobacteraceae bacterium]|nr:hypothetical protein [Candidatus Baltobacteraceae bacterium]
MTLRGCGIAIAAAAFVLAARSAALAADTEPFTLDLTHPIGGVWNEYANPGEEYPQALDVRVRASLGQDAASLEYHRDVYLTQSAGPNSLTRYATLTGGYATVVPFMARDSELEGHYERRVRGPLAVGIGALHTWTNYAYPPLTAVGVGIERLPDWTRQVALFGSAFYYPAASGSYGAERATFGILKYDVGFRFRPFGAHAYITGGYDFESRSGRHLPGAVRTIRSDPYIGIGTRL